MNDEEMMSYAIELAEKGVGAVNPNPLVGAVVVKNGRIIGRGYHEKYGELHAERNALKNCVESPEGAVMYVTLEPCCHFGKTPPCTEAIIENKVSKVFVGAMDRNPLVAGKGVEILRNNGIEVVTGVLKEKCYKQNEVFFNFIESKRPFVVMKYAMTLDGKIATVTGDSKWITGEEARARVHQDRNRYKGIMVGVGTVIADNPMLNCRIEGGRNPIRIICDTGLRTPLDCNIVKSAESIETIIATGVVDKAAQQTYIDKGVKILEVGLKGDKLDLDDLMIKLGELSIDSILLEGGSELNFSALESGIVNKVQCYIGSKIFGGVEAKTPVGGLGFTRVLDSIKLKNQKVTVIGEDILIESEVVKCLQESL